METDNRCASPPARFEGCCTPNLKDARGHLTDKAKNWRRQENDTGGDADSRRIWKEASKMRRYAFYEFDFGILKIGYTDTAVVLLKRVEQLDADNEPSALSNLAFAQICAYLRGQRKTFDFPYELHGTKFQKDVWEALRQIPYGQTRTYGQVAAEVGNPKAGRAVGMANHENPLMIVIPCHRVVGSDGKLVGYAGGLDMKKALLELERRGDR